MKLMSEMFAEMLANDKQPMYVAVKPDPNSVKYFDKLIAEHNIPNPLSTSKLHCTLIYSKKPTVIPQIQVHRIYRGTIDKFDVFDTRDGKRCLVAKIISPDLMQRHRELMIELDASYDFPDYIAHISLSYDIGDFDYSKLNNSISKYPVYFLDEYYQILDDLAS
jgi:hypothetical protein